MVRVRYSFGSRHTGNIKNIKKQRTRFPDAMREVIRISDIVLIVFDVRFASEMRNLEIEKMIKDKGARIIYVFNKVDLVDVVEVKKKLDKDMQPSVFVSVKSGRGARDLRERIKIEASRLASDFRGVGVRGVGVSEGGEKFKRVHVGVVGYPNVGKSSLINLITRKGAAKTSHQAGYTKGMQKIRMNDKITILDTPGVIPEEKYSSGDKNVFARDIKVGARTYSNVRNPEDVVLFLLKENAGFGIRDSGLGTKIGKFYEVDFEDGDDLIEKLGRKMNFLSKGGKVDVDRTARIILRDWQTGKIKI